MIAVTVPSPAGTVACPAKLPPQQAAVPSVLTAHVWLSPAAIAVTVPSVAGTVVCPESSSPQQRRVPSV